MTNTINTRVTENQNSELHNNLEECRYVDCSEFESSYNKLVGISALHLNISSLSKHIDSLGNMLEQLALDFNVIAISETCLLYTSPSPRDLSTSRMPSSA